MSPAIPARTVPRATFRFFLNHSGYSTPPGRAVCALRVARAWERFRDLAAENLARFRWEVDEDPDLSWMTSRERARDHEVFGCVLEVRASCDCDYRCDHWRELGSLWGIVDPDGDFRRVIEGDLAYEYL